MKAPRCALSLALLLPVALLSGCAESEPPAAPRPAVREISRESAGENIAVLRTNRELFVTYPDLGALSLNLVRLSLPDPESNEGPQVSGPRVEQTTYLDRISETPEIDERFGLGALVFWQGLLNVFYADQEREGPPVLKWVSGPSPDGRWWIDILPFSGQPLAALPVGEDVELYLLQEGAIVRRSLRSAGTEELLNPCLPAGEIFSLVTEKRRGITVFDRSSQRLYALLHGSSGTETTAIYTAGAVHHSLMRGDQLKVLLFSPQESTLLLLEEREDSGGFVPTPVTLCEGTTAVFLGYRSDRPFFLYTERAVDREGESHHLLSLLTPTSESAGRSSGNAAGGTDGGSGTDVSVGIAAPDARGSSAYKRTQLLELQSPIRRIRAVVDGRLLTVFFVQDTLKMFSVDLDEL